VDPVATEPCRRSPRRSTPDAEGKNLVLGREDQARVTWKLCEGGEERS
jgi:hypothetical protein